MSLKKECPPGRASGPENPSGGGSGGLQQSVLGLNPLERPLDRIYGPTEDTDWQEAFWASLRSPPGPSTLSRGEEDTSDITDPEQPVTQTNANEPIQLDDSTAQVVEVEVPVVSLPPPPTETISSELLLPLWSEQFISQPSSPPYAGYASIPLYRAEGIQDPEMDEGIDEPSSPLESITSSPLESITSSPLGSISFSPLVANHNTIRTNDRNNHNATSTPLSQPEEFFDDCNFLQMAMDDSIAPNIFASSTVTTETFITPIKVDEASEAESLPLAVFSVPASPAVKSELDDSDWEPDVHSTSNGSSRRKRGRPSKPPGCRTITPRPQSPTDSNPMSEAEVSAQKYRRMRDLNNEASRRCREQRKEKAEEMELEAIVLEQKNIRLKKIVAEMEEEISKLKLKLKKVVLEGVSKPANTTEATQEIQAPRQFTEEDTFLGNFDFQDTKSTLWP